MRSSLQANTKLVGRSVFSPQAEGGGEGRGRDEIPRVVCVVRDPRSPAATVDGANFHEIDGWSVGPRARAISAQTSIVLLSEEIHKLQGGEVGLRWPENQK